MAFKITLWLITVMFISMVYNGVSAYQAMGSTDVQKKFEKIGLIEDLDGPDIIIPVRKPVMSTEVATLD